jgi:hypothetical protein
MNTLKATLFLLVLSLSACGIPKSYFTVGVRTKLEGASIAMEQLQFYVDRDVELRRELASGEAKVTSGKVKFENGKYIHIIYLKRFTPGVCTAVAADRLDVSFEMGDGKSLVFGVPAGASPEVGYQIFAQEWVRTQGSRREVGKITYDGNSYFIQPNGIAARLLIQKSVVDKFEVERRVMKGRKIE